MSYKDVSFTNVPNAKQLPSECEFIVLGVKGGVCYIQWCIMGEGVCRAVLIQHSAHWQTKASALLFVWSRGNSWMSAAPLSFHCQPQLSAEQTHRDKELGQKLHCTIYTRNTTTANHETTRDSMSCLVLFLPPHDTYKPYKIFNI